MPTFPYIDPGDTGLIGICTLRFRDTIPGYYDNMTLTQCRRKMSMTPPHMWMKSGVVQWTDAGQQKSMRVALDFHKRMRFQGANGVHYYLSVGISDPITPDVALGAEKIAEAIKSECQDFDTTVMTPNSHRNQLYLAHQATLDLSQTRLGPIFLHASNNGWLGQATQVPQAMNNNNSAVVWPDLIVRKLQY